MRLSLPVVPLALLVVLCAVLVGAGCGSAAQDNAPIATVFNPCSPLVIDTRPGLDEAESASVDQALKMWNDAAPLALTRQPVDAAPHIPVSFVKTAPFVRGYYDDAKGTVLVNRALTAHAKAIILAHELGHAFGLHHVSRDTRHSVMNPGTPDIAPTARDAEVLMEHWPTCGAAASNP